MALVAQQTWALIKKDLTIIVRRRWLGTSIRALIFPVIFTFVLSYLKYWTATGGVFGVGQANPIRSFSDALHQTGSTRPTVVIANHGFTDGDIGDVMSNLSATIKDSGKQLQVVSDNSQFAGLCPSSTAGVSSCFGAVEFYSSPDHPNGNSDGWNYTLYGDGSLAGSIDVSNDNNPIQVYLLPFQRAVDSAIASTHGGAPLPEVSEYPYTYETEAEKEQQNNRQYIGTVSSILAFAFFVGYVDLAYHGVGYVCAQREQGLLQLMDGMLPNRSPWHGLIARNLATHIVFDLIYLPGWVAMGAIVGSIAFSGIAGGYFILLYILSGLAMTSYCTLVSSLFRRAQLSAITSSLVAFVFAVIALYGEGYSFSASNSGVLATGFLFPPCAFVFFFIVAGAYGGSDELFQINVPSSQIQSWAVSASTFFGCLVFQILLYPILGVIIERYLHGARSKARTVSRNHEASGEAVVLDSFTKTFKSKTDKKQKVKAVNGLSLRIPTGAITVILGANGSGKTTTLNAIAGLESVTDGTIKVDGTGGIGICPQHNIMYNELTVEEHVSFFERLKTWQPKSRAEHKAEVDRLIEGCDLGVKRHARAKTLSGGQKRKLQLAMMLAGGSRVCCIDEASSGIDPLARRKIWNILLKERGKRSLILTTHFLDEADILSDHIAIMSSGELKAEGSAASLKNELGGGYRVSLASGLIPDELLRMPNVKFNTDYQHTVAELPDTPTLVLFIAALKRYNITQYSIRGPTIENVFLGLADEMQASSGLAADLRLAEPADALTSDETAVSGADNHSFDLDTGVGSGLMKQTAILFHKRLTILRHTFMPYFWAVAIPLLVAGVVTRFFISLNEPNGIACFNQTQAQEQGAPVTLYSSDILYHQFVYGPASQISLQELNSTIPVQQTPYDYQSSSSDFNDIPTANSSSDFAQYVSSHIGDLGFGGVFINGSGTSMVWSAGDGEMIESAMLVQSITNQLLMNKAVTFSYQPFQISFQPPNGVTVLVAIFTVLGFAVYPCLFALYPAAERLRSVRAMQYSNGIRSSSLWLAYLLFDFIFILIISIATVGLWAGLWSGWYSLGYMFVVFVLYGLASTAFSYVVSLFASSQLVAMAVTLLAQCVTVLLYFTGYIVASFNASPTDLYTWFNYIAYTVGLISPSSNLLRALWVVLNDFSLACSGTTRASYPGGIEFYGQPILYLTLQFIFLAAFLMYWESGRSLEVFGIHLHRKSRTADPEKSNISSTNPDATESPARLSTSNNGLRVSHLSKWFGPTHAVDDVSFGILPSEKFALLGPNGAGKSTVISLVRGELSFSNTPGVSTAVHVGGDDIVHAPMAVKNHLGVCPQFDATDSMTLHEHLLFYARARGVAQPQRNINELLQRLGLEEHKNKLAAKLSGGTRRKLSLAVALVANPSVLLLDEPSSGMDPAAKRALWRTLAAVSAGRALLLTTHSMEEADALCERAGIMASRLLALGSTEDLRDKFGRSVTVHLSHKDAPWSRTEDIGRMRNWVADKWPMAETEPGSFGGQLRFSVPREPGDHGAEGDGLMSSLFADVEAVKTELGVADYAIGPATLDRVFLNVVGKHDVQEENTQTRSRRGWARWLKS